MYVLLGLSQCWVIKLDNKTETEGLWEYITEKENGEPMLKECKENILQVDEAKEVYQKRLHGQRAYNGEYRSSTEEVVDPRS